MKELSLIRSNAHTFIPLHEAVAVKTNSHAFSVSLLHERTIWFRLVWLVFDWSQLTGAFFPGSIHEVRISHSGYENLALLLQQSCWNPVKQWATPSFDSHPIHISSSFCDVQSLRTVVLSALLFSHFMSLSNLCIRWSWRLFTSCKLSLVEVTGWLVLVLTAIRATNLRPFCGMLHSKTRQTRRQSGSLCGGVMCKRCHRQILARSKRRKRDFAGKESLSLRQLRSSCWPTNRLLSLWLRQHVKPWSKQAI